MSTEPEITRIVRSWLEEGVSTLPDRVLDRVLDDLPATPQRRARWPAWRLNTMATPIRFTAAAAAIGILAVVAGIVPRSTGPGGPNMVGSPSPLPSAAPFPDPGAVLPGTYQGPLGEGHWTVSVPAGWEWFYDILFSDLGGPTDYPEFGGPGEIAFGWWNVANVFTDPCHWKDSLADPPVGPTVNDLAEAFLAQAGRGEGSGPTDVVFGGYPAKRIEVTIPASLDVATCDEGFLWEFVAPGDSAAVPPEVRPLRDASGRIGVLYILDIDGTRWLMNTWHYPETSAEDLAELEAMLASVRIDPPAPSPSPST